MKAARRARCAAKAARCSGVACRASQGWYQLNPNLAVRRRQGDEETWTPACAALNLPLINEFSRLNDWGWPETIPKVINRFLVQSGLPGWRVPIAAERAVARAQALEEQRLAEARALQAQREAEQAAAAQKPIRWGGPQAKRLEIERIRREIEARKKR